MATNIDTLEGEWQDLAIDDGSIVLEQNEYYAELDDGTNTLSVQIENISYSPKVRSAKNLNIDVPPDPDLEGNKYLGETLTVFVDNEKLFVGDIIVIETNQRDGENYNIEAEPPAKRLKGDDIDKLVGNSSIIDELADTVDKYNEYDADHEEFRDSDDESLSDVEHIGANVLQVVDGSASGTATYSSVGSDGGAIDAIYVKAYTEPYSDFDVTVTTNSSSYSETITETNTNKYGEWVLVEPSSLASEKYDLEFSFTEEARLVDWIVITDHELKRDVVPPEVESVGSGSEDSLYSRNTSELVNSVTRVSEGMVVDEEKEKIRPREVTAWNTLDYNIPNAYEEQIYLYYAEGQKDSGMRGAVVLGGTGSTPPDAVDEYMSGANNYNGTIEDKKDTSNPTVSVRSTEFEPSVIRIEPDQTVRWSWNTDDTNIIEENGEFKSGSKSTNDVFDHTFTSDVNRVTVNQTSSAVAGQEIVIKEKTTTPDLSDQFNVTDPLQEFSLNLRAAYTNLAGVGSNSYIYLNVIINGKKEDELKIDVDDIASTGDTYSWLHLGKFFFEEIEELNEVVLEVRENTEADLKVDCLNFTHKHQEWSYTFDNSLDSNNHLSRPAKFAHPYLFSGLLYVEFEPYVAGSAIDSATSTVDYDDVQNPIGPYGIAQSIASAPGEGYNTVIDDNTSISQEFFYPGNSHSVRVFFTAGGDGYSTPTEGFNRQEINSISVETKENNIDMYVDDTIQDNRLGAMNSIASGTNVYYRFDGDTAKIFKRGSIQTDVSLYKEEISSKRDISETYKSCKTIGKNNVKGDRIQAANIPASLTKDKLKDKLIQSRDIESKEAADVRSESFIRENSDIEYTGDITTLPTLAPLGALMPGKLFSHGQDMMIESVRYSKRRTDISLGLEKNLANQIVAVAEDVQTAHKSGTKEGMTVPSGDDAYSRKVR